MAMSGGTEDGEPMGEMNTTPLIDVMLVLLVMMIITIPIQTHAVKIDLPVKSKNSIPPVNSTVNRIDVTPGNQILWNAAPVNLQTLEQLLQETVAMTDQPELHVRPDPAAQYARVDEVFAAIKRAKVTKMGFVGNENYAEWQQYGDPKAP